MQTVVIRISGRAHREPGTPPVDEPVPPPQPHPHPSPAEEPVPDHNPSIV
jgi:hypothetical protein